ncbi:hypothetical protein TSAR_010909, partial [Trichomalopsis sarcophagae]
ISQDGQRNEAHHHQVFRTRASKNKFHWPPLPANEDGARIESTRIPPLARQLSSSGNVEPLCFTLKALASRRRTSYFQLLACILIGLHYHSQTSGHEMMLTTGTYCGYVIILVGLFAGGVMGTPVNRRVDLFFSLVGCALFIASGAVVIDNHQHESGEYFNKQMAKASISIIEGVLFFVDAVFTFKGEA